MAASFPASATQIPLPPRLSRYPFTGKANVIDRESITVPTGWDSYGKIRVLKESFDCSYIGNSWARDLHRNLDVAATPQMGNGVADGEEQQSLLKIWESALDPSRSAGKGVSSRQRLRRTPANGARAAPQREHDFLQTHFDLLAKEAAKDPRSAFGAAPTSSSRHSHTSSQSSILPGMNGLGLTHEKLSGVVGPLGSSSLSLPSVERALDRDSNDDVPASPAIIPARNPLRKVGLTVDT